jgi:hypothetical protein
VTSGSDGRRYVRDGRFTFSPQMPQVFEGERLGVRECRSAEKAAADR